MIIGSIIGLFLIIFYPALAWFLAQVIAYVKIFIKFGEPWWKAIIPVYHTYVQIKNTWDTKWFWVYLVSSGISYFLYELAGDNNALIAISWILSIVGLAIIVVSMFKLSKAFNHGTGFALGLIFLEPIFMLILGWGKSEYVLNSQIKE